jgi:hypothetical protein
MRKTTILFFFYSLLFTGIVQAGNPEIYFQQKLKYEIKAELDDLNHRVIGSIRIIYENNSDQALDTIWFHLWPNAYSGSNTPLCKQLLIDRDNSLYFSNPNDLGRITDYQFSINGSAVKIYKDGDSPEIVGLLLDSKLEPGGQITIETPFQVAIPDARFSRMGRDNYSYNLTQWFPKPAVFDKGGWHCMSYLSRGEFYSEFGDFEVELTVPSNYTIAASGELMTESERNRLLQLDAKTRKKLSDAVIYPKNEFGLIASAIDKKTVRYELRNAHDFAWFASKYYQVMLDTVVLESGKKVGTSAFFGNQRNDLWKDALSYSKSGLVFLSNEIGDYPYESFAVVDGRISAGGGMEYPGITILNTPASASDLERVLVHELGHNWFYGALASNEREHPWMDEGMNSYYEYRYMSESRKSPDNITTNGITRLLSKALGVGSLSIDSINDLSILLASYDNSDQPITTRSEDFNRLNYGVIAYTKTAFAFDFLFDYLGEDLSERCIKDYYSTWSYRHPDPKDLQASFEKSSGQDLDWFFDDFLMTNSPHSVCVKNIDGETPMLRIRQNSGPKVPLYLEWKNGGAIWINHFENDTLLASEISKNEFTINRPYHFILKNRHQVFNENGHGKWRSPKLRLFPSLYDSFGSDNMFLMPAVGWNEYDGLMAGVTISNMELVPAPFEFSFTPMYSEELNNLVGFASVRLKKWPIKGIFNGIALEVNGKRFGYDLYENRTPSEFALIKTLSYSKWNGILGFEFREHVAWSPIRRRVDFQATGIYAVEPVFTMNGSSVQREFKTVDRYHGSINYNFTNSRIIDPFSYHIRLENGTRYAKLSGEFKYRFTYRKPRKGFDVRLFAGGFVKNQSSDNVNFRMSSWTGANDYLFNEIFAARNETSGLWSRQMLIRDGGFISPTPLGQTNKWIGALHLSTDNPTPIPLRFFFNIGTFDGIRDIFLDINGPFMYEGGVSLSLIKGIAEIHVPVFQSGNIQRTFDTNNVKFADRIRFVLDLSQLSFDSLRTKAINGLR